MPRTTLPLARVPLTRRAFLALTATTAAGFALGGRAATQPAASPLPITGLANPQLDPFDQLLTSFVATNRVPGAALAVTHHGKLVYARGFGYADVDAQTPVQPASLFRIASVSKPLTAVALLQLVEQGKLKLDDPVLTHLKLPAPIDPRWSQITVHHCLQHTGGWDRDQSFDPIGRPWEIAKSLRQEPPITPAHLIRYMLAQPLDFTPGERFAYSNFGYLVLARVLESVTGQAYEAYVKQHVLSPLGIKSAQLGHALLEQRAPGEVRYYDPPNRTGPALFPPHLRQRVPLQYGAENFDAFEAHGGWIASAVDLVRFASSFDDPAKCPLLSATTIATMWARPDGRAGSDPAGKPAPAYYGCGWMVRPVGAAGRVSAWHTGLIAGTSALLVRRWDGLNWAVLFNTHAGPAGKPLADLIDGPLHEAAAKVKSWPDSDQFDSFLK